MTRRVWSLVALGLVLSAAVAIVASAVLQDAIWLAVTGALLVGVLVATRTAPESEPARAGHGPARPKRSLLETLEGKPRRVRPT